MFLLSTARGWETGALTMPGTGSTTVHKLMVELTSIGTNVSMTPRRTKSLEALQLANEDESPLHAGELRSPDWAATR